MFTTIVHNHRKYPIRLEERYNISTYMTNAQSNVANEEDLRPVDLRSFEEVFQQELAKKDQTTTLLTKERYDLIIKTLQDCNSTDLDLQRESKKLQNGVILLLLTCHQLGPPYVNSALKI